MTEPSSNYTDSEQRRGFLAWILFPISLFPLVALLTYDWRTIEALNTPADPSANWIGALGDCFAYYGYATFGLAIWLIPVLCIVLALCLAFGRRLRFGFRLLWFTTFLISVSCLLQDFSAQTTWITAAAHHFNMAQPGGAVGYLLMTCCLCPLLSNFGSAVIMILLLIGSLIATIGMRNVSWAFRALLQWALPPHATDENTFTNPDVDTAIINARAAAAEANRQEKERARAEKAAQKVAQKEARRLEKERLKAEKSGGAATPVRDLPSQSADAAEDKGPYLLPSLSLLNPLKKSLADHSDVGEMSRRLIDTLKVFGVDATLSYTVQGPVVTKYALKLAQGTRYSAVTNISDNLMGALQAKSLRIEAPIPGEDHVGIEVPNKAPAGISFREIIESATWKNFKGELPLLFGRDAAGSELVADLASMPHMLVAGATGQGKSVCLNAIINGLLMTKTPDQLKLIMVDPKSVEFTAYASIPHLIVPIITDNKKVVFSLQWAVVEMEKRLKLFARARVRNIYDFNHRLQFTQTDMFGNDTEVGSDMPKTLPYVVIIIDEVADLMAAAAKEVVPNIARLTAKARAAGIHLILATQRPDAKVITGTIKANIPGRVAFKTTTAIDSRTILDDGGAENLIGRGDMLFKSKEGLLIRAQGAWISDPEIARITAFIEQHSTVQFDDRFSKKLSTIKEAEVDIFADPDAEAKNAQADAASLREQVKADAAASDFKKAVECLINTKRASTSHFQRQMGWGYNHAAKILDMLEAKGIVAPQSGMGPRQIIMDQDQLLAIFNGESSDSSTNEGNLNTTDGSQDTHEESEI